MTEIISKDRCNLLDRFPKIELSYETIPHTKVSPDYNICVGIPVGTKGYAWLTFHGTDDVCFLMEMNKDRNFTKITEHSLTTGSPFATGTLFYGTIVGPTEFVIEDIFYYQSVAVKSTLLSEKLGFLERFLQLYTATSINAVTFRCPQMWSIIKTQSYDCLYDIPANIPDIGFHHIQYRCLKTIAPYLNVFPTKKGFAAIVPVIIQPLFMLPWRQANFTKPQYKQLTVFKVMADFQYDIYRLFIYGSNKTTMYYNVACIPNYKTSVMMNKIFRKIKENDNLDAIEESDDEEDFENVDPEKNVDLQKSVLMECRFHQKFKKWIPVRIVDAHQKVTHVSQL